MQDPLLQERYIRHLESLIELSGKEVARTHNNPTFHSLAQYYHDYFQQARHTFGDVYQRNLIHAFRKHMESGHLELMTCGATHGFLPLLHMFPRAVRAQVKVAADFHERTFGRPPRGIWLPECGYHPRHDFILRESGMQFFFVDAHGLLFATPRPKYGVYAPVFCPSGVAAFGRDLESSKQVWSAEEGYPGDYEYREFYRDVGYDLPLDTVGPYLHPPGLRKNLGIKYYRITGRTQGVEKQPYDPHRAREKAAIHAEDFLDKRIRQAQTLSGMMDRPPLIVSPYDAELFGHWWFEGPQWIEFLARKIHFDQDQISMITPREYLERFKVNQVVQPSMSTWGHKGYNEVWLEGSNDWIYRHLHNATRKMIALAHQNPGAQGLRRRALNQAARELLLAQSSDWAFIMKTGTMVPYAERRTREHVHRFLHLHNMVQSDRIDEEWLREIESRDNLFPDIDYQVYADPAPPELGS